MKWPKPGNSRQVLLVYPHPSGMVTSNDAIFPFPVLGLAQLAAALPQGYTTRIIDERLRPLTGREEADLVLITTLTFTAHRAYALADRFRKRGIPVVLGGVHATILPDEASGHATSVVTGEAEGVLPGLLADFESGTLARRYTGHCRTDLDTTPFPRQDKLSRRHRLFFSALQTGRGCPHECNFCSVPVISGRRMRFKSEACLDRELAHLAQKGPRKLFVVDDNFLLNRERALAVMKLFCRHGFRWSAFSNLSVAADDAFLHALKKNNCVSLFIGFESLNPDIHLAKNRTCPGREAMEAAVAAIHAHSIGIQGSFIFGFDQDTTAVFEETVAFIQDTGIDIPHVCLLTPFPGTPLYRDLDEQGRLLHYDWRRYTMNHVVFRPAGMRAEELQQGYAWAIKFLASPSSILARLRKRRRISPYFAMANFALHRSQTLLARNLWNRRVQKAFKENGICPC